MRRRTLLACLALLIASQGAAQQPANCPLGYTVVAADLTVWACRGPSVAPVQVSTGGGGGDLLAANNLSDVANTATAFTNIKQTATTTTTGAVELATDGESAANLVPQANDARLSNARTPTAHASTHVSGQSDAIAAFTSAISGLVPASGGGTTNFLRADGTFAAPAGGGYRTKVTLGGDVTDSSGNNTYTDCTGLSFAVTSGTRYNFEATIWYTAAATTTGSGWALNGPATTDMAYSSRFTLTATTGTQWTATAYNTPATSNASSLTAGNIATINGTILPSANGTVIVRFMTEVDTSAIVCKAGSTLEWWTP